MSVRVPMGSEPRLVAMANQADRRNRPTALIALAAVVVLGAFGYLFVGVTEFRTGSRDLERQRLLTSQAKRTAELIDRERASRRDPSEYGTASLMPEHLRRAASEVFGVGVRELAGIVDIPSSPEIRALTASRELSSATVTCEVQGRSLEEITAFVETSLSKPELSLAFVSQVRLVPQARGWNASIEFRRYAERR